MTNFIGGVLLMFVVLFSCFSIPVILYAFATWTMPVIFGWTSARIIFIISVLIIIIAGNEPFETFIKATKETNKK